MCPLALFGSNSRRATYRPYSWMLMCSCLWATPPASHLKFAFWASAAGHQGSIKTCARSSLQAAGNTLASQSSSMTDVRISIPDHIWSYLAAQIEKAGPLLAMKLVFSMKDRFAHLAVKSMRREEALISAMWNRFDLDGLVVKLWPLHHPSFIAAHISNLLDIKVPTSWIESAHQRATKAKGLP